MSDLTAKQEAFALAFVEVGNASEAYRRSHDVGDNTKPETIWSEASRLMANPKVSARVKELQAEARAMMLVTVGSLTEELEAARKLAMSDEKGASAAVAAVMGKAKLHGLLIEKREVTGAGGKDLIPDKSPRELARELAFALALGRKDTKSE